MKININDLFDVPGTTGGHIEILILDMRLVGDGVLVDIERTYHFNTNRTDNDSITVTLDNLKAWLSERVWTKR